MKVVILRNKESGKFVHFGIKNFSKVKLEHFIGSVFQMVGNTFPEIEVPAKFDVMDSPNGETYDYVLEFVRSEVHQTLDIESLSPQYDRLKREYPKHNIVSFNAEDSIELAVVKFSDSERDTSKDEERAALFNMLQSVLGQEPQVERDASPKAMLESVIESIPKNLRGQNSGAKQGTSPADHFKEVVDVASIQKTIEGVRKTTEILKKVELKEPFDRNEFMSAMAFTMQAQQYIKIAAEANVLPSDAIEQMFAYRESLKGNHGKMTWQNHEKDNIYLVSQLEQIIEAIEEENSSTAQLQVPAAAAEESDDEDAPGSKVFAYEIEGVRLSKHLIHGVQSAESANRIATTLFQTLELIGLNKPTDSVSMAEADQAAAKRLAHEDYVSWTYTGYGDKSTPTAHLSADKFRAAFATQELETYDSKNVMVQGSKTMARFYRLSHNYLVEEVVEQDVSHDDSPTTENSSTVPYSKERAQKQEAARPAAAPSPVPPNSRTPTFTPKPSTVALRVSVSGGAWQDHVVLAGLPMAEIEVNDLFRSFVMSTTLYNQSAITAKISQDHQVIGGPLYAHYPVYEFQGYTKVKKIRDWGGAMSETIGEEFEIPSTQPDRKEYKGTFARFKVLQNHEGATQAAIKELSAGLAKSPGNMRVHYRLESANCVITNISRHDIEKIIPPLQWKFEEFGREKVQAQVRELQEGEVVKSVPHFEYLGSRNTELGMRVPGVNYSERSASIILSGAVELVH